MSISALTSRMAGLSPENRSLIACGGSTRGHMAMEFAWTSFSYCIVVPFQILGYFDYAFTAIFTVEILLKVIMAFSLILTFSKAAVAIIVAILCFLPDTRLCRLCLHWYFCIWDRFEGNRCLRGVFKGPAPACDTQQSSVKCFWLFKFFVFCEKAYTFFLTKEFFFWNC